MHRTIPRILGAIAVATIGLVAYAGISAATPSPTTFYACMNSTKIVPGSITTDSSLTCGGKQTVASWSSVGPQGPAGPIGATGATGAPGPQWVVQAFVLADGSILTSGADPGTSFSVTHVSTGEYELKASGLGTDNPMPNLTTNGTNYTLAYGGGFWSSGGIDTFVFTSNGHDENWSFSLVGSDPPNGSAPTVPIPPVSTP